MDPVSRMVSSVFGFIDIASILFRKGAEVPKVRACLSG
jgi:hypothetical protein